MGRLHAHPWQASVFFLSAVLCGTQSTPTLSAGVAATDWNAVAKKEHLDQLTVELRRLEDNIREVYTDMLMLQQREQEMRDISGECNLPCW